MGWEIAYADQLPGDGLISDVADAIAWTNSLIRRIDAAR